VCIIEVFFISGMLNLRNTTFKVTSLTITWDPASSFYCGGLIYYQVVISYGGQLVSNITTTGLNATFNNLMGGTAYNVTVIATNRAGNGITEVRNVITEGNDEACIINYLLY